MTLSRIPPTHTGIALISVTAVFGVLAITTTCFRIAVRWKRQAIGWDDSFMIAALVFTIIRFSIVSRAATVGYGHHQDDLSSDRYALVNFYSWLGQIFLFVCLCLTKISIGLLIMRIKADRKSRLLQWTLIAGLILTNVEVLIVLLAECRPISAYWNPEAGECWPTKTRIYSIYVQAGYGIFTDLVYSAMPIAIVRRLQMSAAKKLAICALTWMGLIATACAALRASSLGLKTSDLSWLYAVTAIYSNVEVGMGIVAANLVLARSFVTFFREQRSSQSIIADPVRCEYALSPTRERKQSTMREPEDHASIADTIVDTESQKHLRQGSLSESATTDYSKI